MNTITLNLTDDQTKRILKILGEEEYKCSNCFTEGLTKEEEFECCTKGVTMEQIDEYLEKKEECKPNCECFLCLTPEQIVEKLSIKK